MDFFNVMHPLSGFKPALSYLLWFKVYISLIIFNLSDRSQRWSLHTGFSPIWIKLVQTLDFQVSWALRADWVYSSTAHHILCGNLMFYSVAPLFLSCSQRFTDSGRTVAGVNHHDFIRFVSKEPQHSFLSYDKSYVLVYTSWTFRKDRLAVTFVRLPVIQQVSSTMPRKLFTLTTFFHFFL